MQMAVKPRKRNVERRRSSSLIDNAGPAQKRSGHARLRWTMFFFTNVCFGKLREQEFLFQVVPLIFHHYFAWNLKCRAMWAGHALHDITRSSRSCNRGFMFFIGHYKLGKSGPAKTGQTVQVPMALICTRAQTHARIHIHTYAHTCAQTDTCTCTNTHTHAQSLCMCVYLCTCMCLSVHMCVCATDTHVHRQTDTCTHTHSHTRTQCHMHTHRHMHAHVHTHVHKQADTNTFSNL